MSISDRLQQAAASRRRAISGQAARTSASRPASARRGRLGRRPPAPPLNDLERKLGFASAALAGVLAVVFWVPHLGQPVAKGHTSVVESLIIGLAMAGLLLWGAALRKRWILAFVALYVGFIGPTFLAPASTKYISVIGLPFIALGGWLVIRGAKAQAAARQQMAAEGDAGRPGRPAGARGAARGPGSRSRKEPRTDATGRVVPTRSKRYTPPKPDPKTESGNGSRSAPRRAPAASRAKAKS
ncbi:MAG: hypothetical protein ACRD0J_05250 [Acidimicrobiales bacterium]